ncbi:YceI family protein [Endozoicomonas sp. Mp262]|uniref:YceI family protein n=1 Tax=Endozoicomonas sp. Mp262 TaxID=2919499 RepID=UPI0021DB70F4
MNKLLVAIMAFCFSTIGFADMTLINDKSSLTFISIKQNQVAEVHRIKNLSGSYKGNKAEVTLDLASIDSKIGIRDQRMRDYLFEVSTFATARFTANIDSGLVASLPEGEVMPKTLDGELELHGQKVPVTTKVNVIRLKSGGLSVTTIEPLIINAREFDMVKGIDKLRQLAGLDSIGYAVPVTFSVEFH